MKEYQDFIKEAKDWQKNRPRFLIEELLPNSNSAYGVIAGRTGRGKTALMLHLACCFATGTPFYGLAIERVPVGYLGFEGNKVNIMERLEKILTHFPTPAPGYLNLEIVQDRYPLKGNVDKLAQESAGLKVLLIDRAKGLVHGDYIKPKIVNEFVDDLNKAMGDLDISCVISLQVRKEHESTRIKVADLDTVKGALDYCEDATFVMLLEQPPGKQPPPEWENLYFAKAREARKELKPIELRYDYKDAMFVAR
jgi:hypothetical protein